MNPYFNQNFVPLTEQGRLVQQRIIKNFDEYFNEYKYIPEAQIVDLLEPNIETLIINKRRVQRTTKSGKQPSFSILVAIGNKKNCIGLAYGNSKQLKTAIQKGIKNAKKKLIYLDETKGITTLTKQIKFKSNLIKYKPAKIGTGLVAGIKIVNFLQLAGIKNAYVKIIGSKNPINYIFGLYKILEEFKK